MPASEAVLLAAVWLLKDSTIFCRASRTDGSFAPTQQRPFVSVYQGCTRKDKAKSEGTKLAIPLLQGLRPLTSELLHSPT